MIGYTTEGYGSGDYTADGYDSGSYTADTSSVDYGATEYSADGYESADGYGCADEYESADEYRYTDAVGEDYAAEGYEFLDYGSTEAAIDEYAADGIRVVSRRELRIGRRVRLGRGRAHQRANRAAPSTGARSGRLRPRAWYKCAAGGFPLCATTRRAARRCPNSEGRPRPAWRFPCCGSGKLRPCAERVDGRGVGSLAAPCQFVSVPVAGGSRPGGPKLSVWCSAFTRPGCTRPPSTVYWPVLIGNRIGQPVVTFAIRSERAGTASLRNEIRQAVGSVNGTVASGEHDAGTLLRLLHAPRSRS